MDELQTLRTRCGEMASEIERLNSAIIDLKQQITATDISWQNAKAVIDEANAQDPAWYKEVGTLEIEIPTRYRKRLETGSINPFDYDPFYARPIPAQQSPAVAAPDWYVVDRTDCDPKIFKREDEALRFARLSNSVIFAKETKIHPVFIGSQSPSITEQDAREIVEYPSGTGELIVSVPDVNSVVIVRDESGEYRRVASSAIKKLNKRDSVGGLCDR